jgi:hypothetical protein
MDLGGKQPLYPKKRKTVGMDIGGRSRRLQPRQENYDTGIAKRIAGSPALRNIFHNCTGRVNKPIVKGAYVSI